MRPNPTPFLSFNKPLPLMLGALALSLILAIAWILISAYRDPTLRYSWFRDAPEDLSELFDILDDQGTLEALRASQSLGSDPAIAYFTWRRVAEGRLDADARLAFAIQRPGWPHMTSMARQMLLNETVNLEPQRALDAWSILDNGSPEARLGTLSALNDLKMYSALRGEVAALWRQGGLLDEDIQAKILTEYGTYLTLDDHMVRFHRLLNQNAETGNLPGPRLAAAASSLQEFIPPGLDLVRVAWATGTPEDLANVPPIWRRHAGLLAKDAWDEQETNTQRASALFRAIDPATANPDALWRLRRILIRNAIRERSFGEAYELAATHGLSDQTDALTAELLAGWIVLTYANLPGLALSHFDTAANEATGPWLKSKALRGKARALDLLGREAEAQAALQDCAAFQTTFYALLCLGDLGEDLQHQAPSPAQVPNSQFESLFSITRMLVHEDRSEREVLPFARASYAAISTPHDAKRLTNLLQDREDLIFTRTTGAAAIRGTEGFHGGALTQIDLDMDHQSGIEPALTLAIIAQESQFRPTVKSPAGAVGLMQILPTTAQEVASDLGLIWTPELLTTPEDNIRLGNVYMAKMLDRYERSVLLASAAYNAGPGNVDRWIRDFGDPRIREIAPEDWIDALTISETRLYVQRVLTNLYLYRLALSRDDVAIDLNSVMVGA